MADEDASLQTLRLACGLDTELLDQRAAADQELAQRVAAPSGARVCEHQPAVCAFVERVKLNEFAGPQSACGQISLFEAFVSQRGENGAMEVNEPLTPAERPVGVALLG